MSRICSCAALLLLLLCLTAVPAYGQGNPTDQLFVFNLGGDQQVPPSSSVARGGCLGRFDAGSSTLTMTCVHNVIGASIMHIHNGSPGANGPIVFDLGAPTSPSIATWAGMTPSEVADLLAGNLYVNIHSASVPAGEIRGQILTRTVDMVSFTADGSQVVPATGATATGNCTADLSNDAATLAVACTHNMPAPQSAHIHEARARVNGATLFTFPSPASPLSANVPLTTNVHVAEFAATFLYLDVHGTDASDDIRGQIGTVPNQMTQTVTFTSQTAKTFGGPTFDVSATASSGLGVTFTSSSLSRCTVLSSTVTIVSAGTCTIVGTQAGDADYAMTQSSQQITINKADQTITFNPPTTKTVGDPPFSLTAVSSTTSGLTLSFISTTLDKCTLSSGFATVIAHGTCTITADQGGNANYNPAPQVTGHITVAPDCTSSFMSPLLAPLGVAGNPYSQAFTLTNPHGAVVYSVVDAPPAGLTVSGNLLSGTPSARGSFSFSMMGTDSAGCTASTGTGISISRERLLAVGAGAGATPLARTYVGSSATARTSGFAYPPSFTGGVSVALGDTNGDGVVDLITGAGPGGGPHVRVFDGRDSSVRLSFFAYSDLGLGIEVASADANGDGFADIITGPTSGSPARIRVFDGRNGNVIRDFLMPGFASGDGVHVAAGDVNGDGWAEILVGAGANAAPVVQVVDGISDVVLQQISPYLVTSTLGVWVAAGDITGDGRADVITGAGGGGPHVRVFDGTTGLPITGPLANFFPYAGAFLGGVRVAAGDLTGDGKAELLTAPGPGMASQVRVFDGATGAEVVAFDALDGSTDGAFVAAAGPLNRMLVDAPLSGAQVTSTFQVRGWAFAESALPGSRADLVHVWAFPAAGGAAQFVGASTTTGFRPDILQLFGGEFAQSGFNLTGTLGAGQYFLVVFVHNATTGVFDQVRVIPITVS